MIRPSVVSLDVIFYDPVATWALDARAPRRVASRRKYDPRAAEACRCRAVLWSRDLAHAHRVV